jgi:signal transduction histidine kinase
MNDDLQAGDVLDAAVQTLINERCSRAYMHDMRGGLQAIYSSLELLARSAKQAAQNPALIDGAASIAKRAMANYEQSMIAIVNQVTGPCDAPAVLNLSTLVQQAQQFLRNDALGKQIALGLSGRNDLLVFSEPNKLRSVILGLLALGIDASPTGAELHVELSAAEAFAVLELRSQVTYDEAIREAQDPPCCHVSHTPQDLVLGFARRWLTANGGRMEVPCAGDARCGLRLFYPLAAGT